MTEPRSRRSVPPPGDVPQPAPPAERVGRPLVLRGIAGSPGVAIGHAVVLGNQRTMFARRHLRVDETPAEVARFHDAVQTARRGIRDVSARLRAGPAEGEASILDAYDAMLGDELIADAVVRHVEHDRMNVEWAVWSAIQALCDRFADVTDPYLAERRHDVMFIGERLLRALAGDDGTAGLPQLPHPSVVLGHDLSPADTAAMTKEPVLAIVTEVGTRTSHTAIMARALEIPAVVGATGATALISPADLLIVDGFRGEIVVGPTPEMTEEARSRAARHHAMVSNLRVDRDRQTVTADGTQIHLRANVELPAEALLAIDHGAEGIGLYRTEFLYVDRDAPPTEEEQYEIFRAVVETVGDRPVTLRTFDIGGDKFVSTFPLPPEMNPALGLRAVRLALSRPDVFLEQLRAMVRASAHGQVRIMIPMVSSMKELVEVKRLVAQAIREVDAAGHARAATIPLGIMVEVPSAAIMSDRFAREADFMSLGTNDLVQYALAIDRTSRSLAYLASPFDPSVLRLIRTTVFAAQAYHRPLSLCGAMASDPLAAALLVGLGLRDLSMEAAAIPEIKEALRRVSLAEAVAIAERALDMEGAEEVERALSEAFGARLADLISTAPEPSPAG